DIRITKIRNAGVLQHRIILVFSPCITIVQAVRQTLVLVVDRTPLLTRRIMMRKYSYQRRLPILPKTAGIARVDDGAARENIPQTVRIQGDGLLLPMDQIPADSMPPM